MTARLFLEAAAAVRPLLDDPALADRWHEASALEHMSIGALAAHLSRSVTLVPGYLDTSGDPPFRDAPGYFLDVFPERVTDPNSGVAVGVRDRADRDAEAGLEAIKSGWDEASLVIADRMGSARHDRGIEVLRGPMRAGDYLITRMLELVVHGDDLAASLGVPTPAHTDEVFEAVTACLVEMATRRSSPIEVIRAFTRLERADPDVLQVF